jgi:hypothetical protein
VLPIEDQTKVLGTSAPPARGSPKDYLQFGFP